MSRGCWQRTWRVPSAAASRSAPKILAIGFGQSSDALERRPEHLGHFPSKIAKSTPGGDMLKIRSGLARSALPASQKELDKFGSPNGLDRLGGRP